MSYIERGALFKFKTDQSELFQSWTLTFEARPDWLSAFYYCLSLKFLTTEDFGASFKFSGHISHERLANWRERRRQNASIG